MTPWDLPKNMRSKVAINDAGCWLWTGARQKEGYGRVKHEDKTPLTHRLAYELLVGPIPSGLHLDHLCRVRRCINPEHLEPVTQQENIRRGAAIVLATPNYPCGHPRTTENSHRLRWKNRPSALVCRTCRREASRRWREAQKERTAA